MLFGPISCKLAGVLEKFELEFVLRVRLVDLLLFFLDILLVDLVIFLDSREGGDGPALVLVLVLFLIDLPFILIVRNHFGLSLQLQAHLCGMPYLVAIAIFYNA